MTTKPALKKTHKGLFHTEEARVGQGNAGKNKPFLLSRTVNKE
jgi:hypothetical protein